MDALQVYFSLRSEIIANHLLIQWFTLIVALTLIVGTVVVERLGRTILSVSSVGVGGLGRFRRSLRLLHPPADGVSQVA